MRRRATTLAGREPVGYGPDRAADPRPRSRRRPPRRGRPARPRM